jgi:hypothetical protein
MTVKIVVICEGPADQRTGCGLADRVICKHTEWITDDVIAHCRSWRGLTPGTEFCLWKHVGDLAREQGIRAYGHFADEPAEPDALVARRALLIIGTLDDAPNAVILLRDDDGQDERRAGLEQARNEPRRMNIPVVVGLAKTKRECWVLAGFEPGDDDEQRRLDQLRQELGFDPTLHAERLDARSPGAKKNAVRVLAELTSQDPAREVACWVNTDLALLAERGAHSGLKSYLDEMEKWIVPLFAPGTRRSTEE